MGNYPLQNFKFIMLFVTVPLAIIGTILFKILFRKYSPEERNSKMAPRIYIVVLVILWAASLILALIAFRDYM